MLTPIIQNPIPHHLEELSLVDAKITPTLIEQLMETLVENRNRLKKFTLVNVHHTEKSFDKLIYFLEDSVLLEELDLSWQSVRP